MGFQMGLIEKTGLQVTDFLFHVLDHPGLPLETYQ